MRFVVSACLLGRNCKYNGGNNCNAAVLKFLADKEYIPVCPEVDGLVCLYPSAGGGNPGRRRPAGAGRRGGGADPRRRRCHPSLSRRGRLRLSGAARDFGAAAVVLGRTSPSCGVRSIYSGDFSGAVQAGCGVAAEGRLPGCCFSAKNPYRRRGCVWITNSLPGK